MARKSPQREERLTRVAEMMLARPGISAAQIARELGVHRATAWRDVQEVRRQWAERRLQAYESRLLDDLARTDRAIEALWPAIEAGKGWAIDRLCSLIATRMKLLGLDTVKHEIDIGELLSQYLARREGDGDGDAAP
jgi:predicted DNA-binding transcriptional regulator YafY